MKLNNKKIMVTGAGGFIASHLIEELVKHGAKIKAFVRYNSRNDNGLIETLPLEIKKEIEIIAGDLLDYDAIYDTMRGCEVVFHLAALIAIPYSYIHPREYIETNVLGTYNILNASRRLNVKKVVHTSTSEVYGTAINVPISEDHPLQAQSPYSASKIGADKIAESFYCSFGLPVATIRPFNTYGPRQSARAVIPTIITQLLRNETVNLGSLFPKRDFTYVKDIVDGFVAAAKASSSVGEVINIGSGVEISIGDLAKKIALIIEKKINIVCQNTRKRPLKSEVGRLMADNRKAKKLLGWAPKYSLDQGLMKTIKWFRENLDEYKTSIYNV